MTEIQETTASLALTGMAWRLCSDMAIAPGDKDSACTAMLWAALELQVGGPDKLARLINQRGDAASNVPVFQTAKPPRFGVYECVIDARGGVGYALWDGFKWMSIRMAYEDAFTAKTASNTQDWAWRDLTMQEIERHIMTSGFAKNDAPKPEAHQETQKPAVDSDGGTGFAMGLAIGSAL
jgi:hypothetical protein